MLGSTTLILLIGPRLGALRGSVRFVANSADETSVGGGHSESGMTGFSAKPKGISTTQVDPGGPHTSHSPSIVMGKSPALTVSSQPTFAPVDTTGVPGVVSFADTATLSPQARSAAEHPCTSVSVQPGSRDRLKS